MSRWMPALVLAAGAALFAQDQKQPPSQPPAKGQGELKRQRTPLPAKANANEELPPEEDESLSVKEYSFNPLQAQKEVRVGNYYFRTHKFRAAEGRFQEAIKWNSGEAEAWLRLGETEERLKDHKAAKDAYSKYLELASDARNAPEIRKKLERLK